MSRFRRPAITATRRRGQNASEKDYGVHIPQDDFSVMPTGKNLSNGIKTLPRKRSADVYSARRWPMCLKTAPTVAERQRLLDLIAQTPNLDWLLLTKRIHLVRKQLPKGYDFPKNVWLGTTVEDQATAHKRIKHLLEFSSPAVRFLSCEPLLSAVDLSPYLVWNDKGNRVDWVIAGGESGPHARPMDPAWPAALQRQCARAKVPFHFKQWGHWAPVDQVVDVLKKSTPIRVIRQDGTEVSVAAIGKGKAGRVLAGKHWDQFPRIVV